MGKIDSLQALRAIAFMSIFFVHANKSPIPLSSLGVSIFFVMSGFLMMHKHYEADENITIRKALGFSLVRIKKIYSLHIITMIAAIILAVALMIQKQGLSTHAVIQLSGNIVLNILLLQTWLPYQYINVSLNGVAWYLSATMFLYCIFPYICKWIKTKSNLITVSVTILFIEVLLCWIMLHFLGDEHPTYIWFMYCFPVFRVGDFFIGCCLGKFYHNKRLDKINPIKGTILELIAFIVTAYIVVSPHKAMGNMLYEAVWNWTTVYIVLASVWIYLFVCSEGILVKNITNKLFVFIGNISAYTFLMHYMVIQYVDVLVLHLGMTMSGWAMVVIMSAEFVITILLTMAYLRFFR